MNRSWESYKRLLNFIPTIGACLPNRSFYYKWIPLHISFRRNQSACFTTFNVKCIYFLTKTYGDISTTYVMTFRRLSQLSFVAQKFPSLTFDLARLNIDIFCKLLQMKCYKRKPSPLYRTYKLSKTCSRRFKLSLSFTCIQILH